MATAPKRRRTSGPVSSAQKPDGVTKATAAAQATLGFRASKASGRPESGKDKVSKAQVAKEVVEIKEAVEAPVVQLEEKDVAGEEEEDVDEVDEGEARVYARALAMPEREIKAYWAGKEAERKAARVHQEGLGVREKVCREFDMSAKFGPSIGISRLARWRRAYGLGMAPPVEVLAVLLKEKGEGGRSVLDGLIMGSRVGDVA